jgi:hypothetical protein
VGEEREVEENGGEEREGKETDRCPLTPTQPNSNIQCDKGSEVHHTQGSQCQPSSTSLGGQ